MEIWNEVAILKGRVEQLEDKCARLRPPIKVDDLVTYLVYGYLRLRGRVVYIEGDTAALTVFNSYSGTRKLVIKKLSELTIVV